MTDRELMQQALEAMLAFPDDISDEMFEAIRALKERLAQPEQKSFCYHDGHNIVGKEFADHSDVFPLYTAPQPPQWQGLTNEEIEHIADSEWEEAFVRMIEAKLKEKNT